MTAVKNEANRQVALPMGSTHKEISPLELLKRFITHTWHQEYANASNRFKPSITNRCTTTGPQRRSHLGGLFLAAIVSKTIQYAGP